ncbi:MAG: hypothetical protein FWB80_09625 [Defluviitaleaceae bacterium]|nr:hypothetical protein [Defluviitaleaceae bacterium]
MKTTIKKTKMGFLSVVGLIAFLMLANFNTVYAEGPINEMQPFSTVIGENGGASGNFSVTTDDRGLNLGNMAVSDYINVFARQARIIPAGFTLMSTTPTTYRHNPTLATVASVDATVSLFRANDDHNIWVLQMQGQSRGATRTVSNFWGNLVTETTGISRFGWRVSQSGGAHLMNWAPSGTTTSTWGGFPINVSITPTIRGVSLFSIGSTFWLNQTNETVTGSNNGGGRFSAEWFTNTPVRGSNPVSLHATLAYNINGNDIMFSWDYPFTWNYWSR